MLLFLSFSDQCGHDSIHRNDSNDDRKDPGTVESESLGHFQAFSCISFCCELIPAPAIAMGAEEYECQASKREDDVGYKEILSIEDGGSCSKRLY